MVVEHFNNKDASPSIVGFATMGVWQPEGVQYISSWVDDKFERCYQLMETDDRALLDEWIANWSDLVDFEVHPAIAGGGAEDRAASIVHRPTRSTHVSSENRRLSGPAGSGLFVSIDVTSPLHSVTQVGPILNECNGLLPPIDDDQRQAPRSRVCK
jgi:hypothetical protein